MKTKFEYLRKRLPVVVLAGALSVAGAAASAFTNKSAEKTKSSSALNVPLDETSLPRDGLPRGSFAPIVKKVAPGVVKIETTTTIQNTSTQQLPGFNDPFWRGFFGDQFGQMFPPHQLGPRHQHGLGSGVIVTHDGYILTNNHVVDN